MYVNAVVCKKIFNLIVFPSDVYLCLWMLPCGNIVVQQIWYVAEFTAITPLLTYKCYVNSWYQFSATNYLLRLLCWKFWTKFLCGTCWCQQVHIVVLHKSYSFCRHFTLSSSLCIQSSDITPMTTLYYKQPVTNNLYFCNFWYDYSAPVFITHSVWQSAGWVPSLPHKMLLRWNLKKQFGLD